MEPDIFHILALRPHATLAIALAVRPSLRTELEKTMSEVTIYRSVLAAGCFAWSALGQGPAWVEVSAAPGVRQTPAAYDSSRDRVVTINARGAAFEHDGSRWLSIGSLPNSLGTAGNALLAYQDQRGRTLALTADTQISQLVTREYDGATWILRAPDHTPPMRRHAHMAYDSLRGRVVLFGGVGGTQGRFDDTWEWDGSDWLRQLPAQSPSRRERGSMAFDSNRGVMVLFGGTGQGGLLYDHWEWNGTNWALRNLAAVPDSSGPGRMAFDAQRNRMVLYGGYVSSGSAPVAEAQPWEFDGQQWSHRSIASAPIARTEHAIVAVGNGVRVFGGTEALANGNLYDGASAAIYDYDGAQFSVRHESGLNGVTAAFDPVRNRTVVVGLQYTSFPNATMRTFEWDGFALNPIAVAGPTPRANMGMAAGPGGTVVGFGGNRLGTAGLADTWTFDGSQWQQHAVAGPSARAYHAMVADPVRNLVVLFGGSGPTGALDDTWEWNGTAWTQVAVSGPSARTLALAAFDHQNGRCILHGGTDGNLVLQGDTWSYTASGWTLIDAGANLIGGVGMAWSEDFSAVVRAGTDAASNTVTEYLVGDVWAPLGNTEAHIALSALAEDPRGHIVGLGGADGVAVSLLTANPGRVQVIGVGCSNAGIPAQLVVHESPLPGNTLHVEMVGASSSQIALFAASFQFGATIYANCLIHVYSPTVIQVSVTNAVGQAMVPIVLPPSGALQGVTFGVQSAVGEIGGPVGGSLGFSQGISVAIGG